MTRDSLADDAKFETTRRLLAELINEGLVEAIDHSPHCHQRQLYLQNRTKDFQGQMWATVNLRPEAIVVIKNTKVQPIIRPADLTRPVIIKINQNEAEELDPGVLVSFLIPSVPAHIGIEVIDDIALELRNSAANQVVWMQIEETRRPLRLEDSSSIQWEQSLIHGHPTHPFHRLCYAQPPLKDVYPGDIPGMLSPQIAFISLSREQLRYSGPFDQLLGPLLRRLHIPQVHKDDAIVPCLAQQIPAIMQRFQGVKVIASTTNCAHAQASMRTVTFGPEIGFKYHLKLSLACQITSALRTITPWTTTAGPILSDILEKFLPQNLWIFKEAAAVTGHQKEFGEARHLSCILREDLEDKASGNNEILILAAAFIQKSPQSTLTYAEDLFKLHSLDEKYHWFKRYVTCLLELFLPPLVKYGIGLESHGQNVVARVSRSSREVTGFAIRDFGGVRLHVPTLQHYGVDFSGMIPGGATMTEDLHDVWSKVHHSLLQNHVGFLVYNLGLESHGGWGIVRDVLSKTLKNTQSPMGDEFYEYVMKDTMPFKCFLRMRMEGKYRDYVEREVPNIIHKGSGRWEQIFNDD
ncbi:ferric iron reductase FhuF-like transporter-domain-containing protein [Aspergillus ambiguus]|uniref:ferric iron reductase FhuF-like transporter-domain-containing protein n=1 Tax=Aspergillus ambiguus TaxID=176160 RepID=UPI003CCDFD21